MIRLNEVWTHPLRPESTFTGSAYTASIDGLAATLDGFLVTGVRVQVTNADGAPFTADAKLIDGVWSCTFSESCFVNYGFVAKGLKIVVTGRDSSGVTRTWTRGVGDFEVCADSASAVPGDPSSAFVVKGGDVYLKSEIVGEVQHYVKQTMVFDEEMDAWGANWSGDYILAGGEFIDADGGAEDA